ncbi:transposase, partial [Patescibacteria group bacterium]
ERKRNRLQNYDYSQDGWCFVTICSQNREEFFGKIENDQMILNEYGKIVKNQWLWLGNQYNYVKLDEYIVMPNHFHGILVIYRRDRSRPVPTSESGKIKSLSELIGAFKTTSSKIIHKNGFGNFAWQRSFYDHIIRDEKSLNNIREYIKNNPMKWAIGKDRNHLQNMWEL